MIKTGVYAGPNGQLVLVYLHRDNIWPYSWDKVLALKVSEAQSFWLEQGSMSTEMKYIIDGYEYLGKL